MADSAWLAIHLCTAIRRRGETISIQPLIRYLESEKPITGELRDWLVKLLKNETDTGHYLEYKTGAGRPTYIEDIERHREIYERAVELRSVIVTREFILQLVESTGMRIADRSESDPLYRLGDDAIDDPEFVDPIMALKVGNPLNKDQVYKIIVKESEWFNPSGNRVSLSTVKTILKDWDEASALD
jgi:hypothetical protein